MEIVFALLTTNVQEFEAQLTRMLPFCRVFQIDIQDGVFVPSSTLSVEDVCVVLDRLKNSHSKSLEGCTFDFHLQVADYLPSLSAIRAIEGVVSVRYIFAHTNFYLPSQSSIESWSLKIENLSLCPALNPEDHFTKDSLFIGRSLLSFPAIQVMTIHPGPQGQSFIPQQLEMVHHLRQSGYKGKILVDGGVNPTTIEYISSLPLAHQPDIVCVGSYLSRAPDQEVGGRIGILKGLVA